jgi:hypothetical protein
LAEGGAVADPEGNVMGSVQAGGKDQRGQRPLGLQVLIELHTVPCASKQPRQGRLAPFERLAA